eukprot:m.31618 g.31618  ORF g.31618 m.31618 type:complete len:415 (-) comp16494_c2_seq1:125-1369(-)
MDDRHDSAVGRGFKLNRRMSKIQRQPGQSVGIVLGSSDDEHIVTQIDATGPAYLSGVRVGDVITSVNTEDVTKLDHSVVVEMIAEGGTNLTFGLQRDGVEQQTGAAVSTKNPQSESLGITVVSGGAFENKTGVTRVDPNSPGERAGLQVGDVLMSVNGVDVTTMEHKNILALLSDANVDELAIGVQRGQEAVKASTSTALVLDLGVVVEKTSEGFIQVVEVFVNGAAEHAGIAAGDLVLVANNENLIKIKFKKAVEILRSEKYDDGTASLVTCSQPQLRMVVRGYQSRRPPPTHPVAYDVLLQRTSQGNGQLEPLGMGIVSETVGARAHCVSTVIEGGCAGRFGILQDDKVVQINGVSIVHLTHERALAMLKQTGMTFTLSIERDAALPAPPPTSRVNAPRTVLETKTFTEVEI